MAIGIFEGKKAAYNRAILQALLEEGSGEGLTNWEIAKRITGRLADRDLQFLKAQRVYSVIARKGSRLDELREKGYIILNSHNKWHLGIKGIWALLIDQPELREAAWQVSQLTFATQKLPNSFEDPGLFEIKISEKLQALLKQALLDRAFWTILAEEADRLIGKGLIDMDKITIETLVTVIATSSPRIKHYLKSQTLLKSPTIQK
jgi:hypothetical protein